jgi:hypothetical protein
VVFVSLRLCTVCSGSAYAMDWKMFVLNDRPPKKRKWLSTYVKSKKRIPRTPCRPRRHNAELSSQVSFKPTNSDREQFRVRTAHCALLSSTAVGSHIVVWESIAVPIHVCRVYQA